MWVFMYAYVGLQGSGEDLSYLKASPRQKIIRRSASLEREALIKKHSGL